MDKTKKNSIEPIVVKSERLEKVSARALERMNHDRYKLSRAVGLRAKELSNGTKDPLISIDGKERKECKNTDIALYEIAEGLLVVEES